MHKLISIILLVFYTSTQAIGLSFNLHYCGEDITDINILELEADCCCAGYDDLKDNCCDDEQVYAKITEEHSAASSVSIDNAAKSIAIATTNSIDFSSSTSKNLNKKYSTYHSLISKQSSWLTFSVLRL